MQRPIMTSSRASSDQCSMKFWMSQSKQSPKRMEGPTDLPIYNPNSSIGRREMSRFKSSEKWVHLIPVIVLLCLFILWCLSYPVNLEIRDGRITAIHKIKMPQRLNDTRVDFTILALATPPNASVPTSTMAANNETTPQLAIETD